MHLERPDDKPTTASRLLHSRGHLWYGMVWYGMVWYGMVWYCTVRYGTVWYMVWYGIFILQRQYHRCQSASVCSARLDESDYVHEVACFDCEHPHHPRIVVQCKTYYVGHLLQPFNMSWIEARKAVLKKTAWTLKGMLMPTILSRSGREWTNASTARVCPIGLRLYAAGSLCMCTCNNCCMVR